NVTGEVTYTDWVAKDGDTTFGIKTTPVVPGYYADQAQIDKITGLTATSGDKNFTVTYKTLANLVPTPSDPSDPNWPKVPSVAYPNDPTDPTQPGQVTVPTVPGYTPRDGDGNPLTPGSTITPTNPGQDTSITYTANDYTITIKYVDVDGNPVHTAVIQMNKHIGDKYNTTAVVVDGYYLTAIPANANGTMGDSDTTVTYVYDKLGHLIPDIPGYTPVDKNGTPLVPGDPYPVDQDTPVQYKKNVTLSIDQADNKGHDQKAKSSSNMTALPETGEQRNDVEEVAGLTMLALAGMSLGFLGFRRKNKR
ncbi:mucin-binding protein, partial [Furfurilactobacillus sp. WILCCON 0119]